MRTKRKKTFKNDETEKSVNSPIISKGSVRRIPTVYGGNWELELEF